MEEKYIPIRELELALINNELDKFVLLSEKERLLFLIKICLKYQRKDALKFLERLDFLSLTQQEQFILDFYNNPSLSINEQFLFDNILLVQVLGDRCPVKLAKEFFIRLNKYEINFNQEVNSRCISSLVSVIVKDNKDSEIVTKFLEKYCDVYCVFECFRFGEVPEIVQKYCVEKLHDCCGLDISESYQKRLLQEIKENDLTAFITFPLHLCKVLECLRLENIKPDIYAKKNTLYISSDSIERVVMQMLEKHLLTPLEASEYLGNSLGDNMLSAV